MDGYRPDRPPRAGNGTRTRDPNLGKVVLYQLSYSRKKPEGSTESYPTQLRAFPNTPQVINWKLGTGLGGVKRV